MARVDDAMELWTAAKMAIADALGLDKDFIHVYVGVVAVLLFAALFRRRAGDWLPIGVLAAFQVANESIDLYGNWLDDQLLYWDHSLTDTAHTLLLPLLIFACARWTALFTPVSIIQRPADEAGAPQSASMPPANPAENTP